MHSSDRLKALNIIADEQAQGCAPVNILIGSTVKGIVQHDTLIIKNAPAHIINVLIHKGYRISICSDGAVVDKY